MQLKKQITECLTKNEIPLPGWVALFVSGAIIEAVGRFFAWHDNPTGYWHEWAPLATTALAISIGIFGYFRFMKGRDEQNEPRQRTGILLIALGLFMIAVSFLLRPAGTPLIVG